MIPKVSVCVVTYNHSEYIVECLNSILSQDVNFNVEVIIGEDNSPDGTRKVIEDFLSSYSLKDNFIIRKIYNTSNVGMNKNWRNVIQHSQGDYITVIEGDDFWSGTNKLQLQIDFLDQHQDFAAVCNDIHILDQRFPENQRLFTTPRIRSKEFYLIADYIENESIFHTSSIIFRNSFKNKVLPEFIDRVMSLDQVIFTLFVQNSKIKLFTESMGSYRLHDGGITNTSKHRNPLISTKNQLTAFSELKKVTDPLIHKDLDKRISKLRFNIVKIRLCLPKLKSWIKDLNKK